MHEGFSHSSYELTQTWFPVPVSLMFNWYRKIERHIKGFSPLLPDRFNWYNQRSLLSVRFGSAATQTPTSASFALKLNTSSRCGGIALACWLTASFTITPLSCSTYWLTARATVTQTGSPCSARCHLSHSSISIFMVAMSSISSLNPLI